MGVPGGGVVVVITSGFRPADPFATDSSIAVRITARARTQPLAIWRTHLPTTSPTRLALLVSSK